jgi:hypothetical protein
MGRPSGGTPTAPRTVLTRQGRRGTTKTRTQHIAKVLFGGHGKPWGLCYTLPGAATLRYGVLSTSGAPRIGSPVPVRPLVLELVRSHHVPLAQGKTTYAGRYPGTLQMRRINSHAPPPSRRANANARSRAAHPPDLNRIQIATDYACTCPNGKPDMDPTRHAKAHGRIGSLRRDVNEMWCSTPQEPRDYDQQQTG